MNQFGIEMNYQENIFQKMDNLIRQGSLLGGTKNIIGNKYSDLVLETLGKVYIKTGNSARVLNDVFKLLDKFNEEDSKSKTLIVESLDDIEYPGDGTLIFDTQNKALYIAYDQRYVLILDSLDYVGDAKGYVKKSGDTMTGTLTIKTEGAPLIVASRELIKNLNAEYLGGHQASRFAVKTLNEKIYGEWSFQTTTNFNGVAEFNNKAIHNDNLVMNKSDIVTNGSIGSPEFMGGMQGYGWRFDAPTQTLTVDYLVVRKAMQVFELVINKIKATNGALWVTDSCEVSEVFEVYYLDITQSDLHDNIIVDRWYIPYNGSYSDSFIVGNNVQSVTISEENLAGPYTNSTSYKTFYNFNYLVKFIELPEKITQEHFQDLNNLENYCEVVHLFSENNISDSSNCWDQLSQNTMYDLNTTPYFYSTNSLKEFQLSDVSKIYTYYKYFGIKGESEIRDSLVSKKIKIVKMKDDTYPTFEEGDLIRCQKFQNSNIKYYDALVGTKFNDYYYVILVADSVFDKITQIKYDDQGNLLNMEEIYNTNQYDKTSQRDYEDIYSFESSSENFSEDFENQTKNPIKVSEDPSVALTSIKAKDELVRIGNLYKENRQNSVFITSSEEYSPYVQTMSGVNRPDYSVVYTTPKFKTKRKVINGVIKECYYTITDEVPSDQDIFSYEWIIDDDMESISDENRYIFTEDGTVDDRNRPRANELLYLNATQVVNSYTDLIELEHLYKKQYIKYYQKPNLNCEIEKNDKTGLYKSLYLNNIKSRFGRLDGIYNEQFKDKQPYGYGLYGDNVFLTGEFFLNNGKAVANIGDDIKFEINDDYGKAGLYIKSDGGKPYIVLNADQIKILNNGKQSALFVNGRIEASLIRVSDLEAADTYKYFVHAITYNKEDNSIIPNEEGQDITTTSFSFKPSEKNINQVLIDNGHSALNWTVQGETTYTVYTVQQSENGSIFTEIDTDYPYVSIDSTTGKLEANSAELTGGKLSLYNQDKSVLVELESSGEHSGMIIYRKNEDYYEPVATYNGNIYNNPQEFYESQDVKIKYDKQVWKQFQHIFGSDMKDPDWYENGYQICYNKSTDNSYIKDWKDEFGHVWENYAPAVYQKTFYHAITEEFILENSCDIRVDGRFNFHNINITQDIHEYAYLRVQLCYTINGSSYYVPFGPESYTQTYYNYGYSQGTITGPLDFSKVIQLSKGTYQFYIKMVCELQLSDRWYEGNEDYYSWQEVPTYFSTDRYILGPDYSVLLNLNNLEVLTNKFETRYFGNGFTSGFNEQNYFSVYNNQNSASMTVDFQSNGSGMKFMDGTASYYANLGNGIAELAMPIPIYTAYIYPYYWYNTDSEATCMRYKCDNANYLKPKGQQSGTIPVVDGYKFWLKKGGGEPMNATSFSNSSGGESHGDIVIDFRKCDFYKGLDLSSHQVIINITGASGGKTITSNNSSICIKGTVVATLPGAIRIMLTDDDSTNDGACYVSIYYLPTTIQTSSEEEVAEIKEVEE